MTQLEPGQGDEPGLQIPTLQPLPLYTEVARNPVNTPAGVQVWTRLTICSPQGSQTYFLPPNIASELGKQLYEAGTGGLILGGGVIPWTPPPQDSN